MARNLEALERKHHRAVRIADLAHALPEGDGVIGRLASLGKFPFDPHLCSHPLENRLKPLGRATAEAGAIRVGHQHLCASSYHTTKGCGPSWGSNVESLWLFHRLSAGQLRLYLPASQ